MNVAELMQSKIDDPKFMEKICTGVKFLDDVYERLGYVLSFIIATRSKKDPTQTFNDDYYYSPMTNRLSAEPHIKRMTRFKKYKNIIKNGYVTHSFNGYNLEKVMENGLGSSDAFDRELQEKLDFVCEKLGESKYYADQGNTTNEFYYTSPGVKTFHYACEFSPERLWVGPLKQEHGKALPITIGESKRDYSMKVLKSKVDSLEGISYEEKKEILDAGEYVIDRFCTKKPVVALIPLKTNAQNMKAYYASSSNSAYDYEEVSTLSNVLKNETGSYNPKKPESMFSSRTYSMEDNNLGDLVSTEIIPAENIEFFTVPDRFEILQQIAILNGYGKGDQIDYFDVVKTSKGKNAESHSSDSKDQQSENLEQFGK